MALSLEYSFKAAPIMGTMSALIDSIYLPRGSNDESRAAALKTITDRQQLVEETGKFAPLLVFAEGGTTNNSAILKFKKGAFVAERRIKPLLLDYSVHTVHPVFDTIQLLPLAILQLSWSCMQVKIKELPDFEPTEYMFETFKD
mgnify:CR=1 FL=1